MPRYGFICRACGRHFDERRSFARSDDPATCPSCGGEETREALRRADGCPCVRCSGGPPAAAPHVAEE
jgi:putative FmdB family regulatory protein